jgi:nucleoside-diphosphate-sugar epimerase
MPTTFVTGGSGFIGGRLIERLVSEGHTVKALARSDQAAEKVKQRGAEPITGDLDNVDAMRAGTHECELAFHAAAMLGDWGKKEDFEHGNVSGTRNVLDACAQAGVGRFVHVGTEAALMDGEPLVQVDETAPLKPKSPVLYSSTKAKAEQLVLDANRDGFETVVVRPRFVWGLGDRTLLPEMVAMTKAGRFAWIDGGKHRTDTTHVDNVVEGLILGATKGRPGNAYFVTDDDTVVFREFVSKLLATQGVPAPSRSVPSAVAGPLSRAGELVWTGLGLNSRPPLTRFAFWVSSQECTIRIDKARRQLGYKPIRTLDDGLAEMTKATHN